MNFDDIDINTASEGPVSSEAEILGPHLPLAKIRVATPLDLSMVANRALTDDVDNDGKGGWTDQGPLADMRELKTGERQFRRRAVQDRGSPKEHCGAQKRRFAPLETCPKRSRFPSASISTGYFSCTPAHGATPKTKSSSTTCSTMPTEKT